jgi:hypothetical protein
MMILIMGELGREDCILQHKSVPGRLILKYN